MEAQEKMGWEIDLKEIFWRLLLGWRQIICLGLVFALLVCGLKYLLDNRSYDAVQNLNVEEAKEELKRAEVERIEEAEQMQIRIDDYEKYMETSAIMQIDPYAKPILELQYYVKSDYIINYTKDSKRDYTGEAVALYCNYISSGELAAKVIEEAGLSIDKKDFGELLQVTQNASTIYVSICYGEADKLQKISDVVKSLLGQKEIELQEIGSHSLVLMSESQNVIVDTALIEQKHNMASNMTSLKTQLQTLKTNMTSEQTEIFDAEMEEIRGEKEEQEVPSVSIMYLIVGAFVGIFMACVWIVCKILFTARLQSADEIRNMYGIRLFGEISLSSEKKRFLSVIDKKILAVKNRRKKSLSVDKQIKVVSANIALSCKQQGIDCIYMTGSEYEKMDVSVLDKIKKELSAQNIEVKEGENISYDASSLQAGIEVGNLLFVEQKGQSIYDEIYQEINMAKEQKANVLGAVVFG